MNVLQTLSRNPTAHSLKGQCITIYFVGSVCMSVSCGEHVFWAWGGEDMDAIVLDSKI